MDDEDISGSEIGSGATFHNGTLPSVIATTITDIPQYHTSKAILAVVAVAAIVTLLAFALATFRYRIAHKDSYKLQEFKTELISLKGNEPKPTNNIYEVEMTKEWLL